ncbi:hypothetical protein OsJ_33357 [Oryza sativa Japonica Group]|uniref:Uncharacterized protein n=1 Tax=Oryza sativa subsp. japonica TaxID=39947 RepID=B9G9Z4_ORYSJ|nr:hypothetical protein OsJ_33357 [Oryza sativa Japonica Group]
MPLDAAIVDPASSGPDLPPPSLGDPAAADERRPPPPNPARGHRGETSPREGPAAAILARQPALPAASSGGGEVRRGRGRRRWR